MKSDATTKARGYRAAPRTFDHFPGDVTCPICGTNDDGPAVLVEIYGTAKDEIATGQPMHLACSVVKVWDKLLEIGVTWPNEKARK